MEPNAVLKRDGSTVPFDRARIVQAISRAQRSLGREDAELADELTSVVVDHLTRSTDPAVPGIEEVQDTVILVLQESGNYDVAMAYARYRDARERQRRRRRLDGGIETAPNLSVLGRDGRLRSWDRRVLEQDLIIRLQLPAKVANEAVLMVEEILADSSLTVIQGPSLMSLIDGALVRCGAADAAERHAALRIDRPQLTALLEAAVDGRQAVEAAGRLVLAQHAVGSGFGEQVLRLWSCGRLWIDGLDDPLRGSEFTAAIDGGPNPWQVLANAFTIAVEASSSWRRVRLILPPILLGHLERGADLLVPPLEQLSQIAAVHLYCDGRTPLLETWPIRSRRVGLATYAEDFLLQARLQELGLGLISGPHLLQGGYRRRVGVLLAINAQGLEDQFGQLDLLAMALVAAARARRGQQADVPALAGADARYAIFGLAPGSSSNEYLERQVVQEGLRCGIVLARTSQLPEEACCHLGRLLGG